MSDALCITCGEPWDMDYVQHDFTKEERKLFQSGKGCPACGGGKSCPLCDGTGLSDESRRCCVGGGGRVTVRKLSTEGVWYQGWQPDMVARGRTEAEALIFRDSKNDSYSCLDGMVSQKTAACLHLLEVKHFDKALHTCYRCRGTGKLNVPSEDERLARVVSHTEASDEDPIAILNRLGEL